MRYYHAALNPAVCRRAEDAPRPSAGHSRRTSMPRRLFWRIVFSALLAGLALYVWRQR